MKNLSFTWAGRVNGGGCRAVIAARDLGRKLDHESASDYGHGCVTPTR